MHSPNDVIQHKNGPFKVPNPFKPVRRKLPLNLTGERLTLSLVELIPNALYLNRKPANKGEVLLKGGEIHSRNDDVAARYKADVRDLKQRHFLTYQTIYDAIRGLRLACDRYRHQEFPVLNKTLSVIEDLKEMIPDLEGDDEVAAAVFRTLAIEQALVHSTARNDLKKKASEKFEQAAKRTATPENIGMSVLIRKVNELILSRGHDVDDIAKSLKFRVQVMYIYLALLHYRLYQIKVACQGTLDDDSIFDGTINKQMLAQKIKRMESFASSFDPDSFPAPHRWSLWHIQKDLLKAVKDLREGRSEIAQLTLSNILHSLFMVSKRLEIELRINALSRLMFVHGFIPDEVKEVLKGYLLKTARMFVDEEQRAAFEKPIPEWVHDWLSEAARLCSDDTLEDGEKSELILEAMKRACEPI